MPLEEFLTKARMLIDDSGYDTAFKEETLRDTLGFGVKSDKVRKGAVSKGNSLTFQQVYDLAKTDESTRAQMQAIRQEDQSSELHDVRSKKKVNTLITLTQSNSTKKTRSSNAFKSRGSSTSKPNFKFRYSGCFRCGNKHDVDATCPAIHAKRQYCKKVGRLKQVNEIVQSPDYNGQDIHLHDDGEDETSDSCHSSSNSDSEPVTVLLDTITSENPVEHSVNNLSSYPDKIFTTVKINDKRRLQMKVDTGADTCVLTTDDLQRLGLSLDIKPCTSVLKSYGGNTIENLGATTLQKRRCYHPSNSLQEQVDFRKV